MVNKVGFLEVEEYISVGSHISSYLFSLGLFLAKVIEVMN